MHVQIFNRHTCLQVTLYDLNAYVIKPATAKLRVSYVELVADDGLIEVVRCPNRHLRMTKVGRQSSTVACDGCGAVDLDEHFQCVRCEYTYCNNCAGRAKETIRRSLLQCPEFFVSHWYTQLHAHTRADTRVPMHFACPQKNRSQPNRALTVG